MPNTPLNLPNPNIWAALAEQAAPAPAQEPDPFWDDYENDVPAVPEPAVVMPAGVNGPQVDGTMVYDPEAGKNVFTPSDSANEMNISTTRIDKIFKYKDITPNEQVRQAMIEVVSTLNKLKVPCTINKQKTRTNPATDNVFVGIEIEVEKAVWSPASAALKDDVVTVYLSKAFGKVWSKTIDNSLRNEGAEFISQPGLMAKDVHGALALFRLFRDIWYKKAEWNYRCGTHIHINVRDLTVEQLISFCFLYILFEDSLYGVSGNRYRNHFCVPIRASGSNIEQLFSLLHKTKPTYNDFRRIFKQFKKYMAFNILPIGQNYGTPGASQPIGTVEFRHHEGSAAPNGINQWVQTILDLRLMATQVPFSELKDTIFDLNGVSNYIEFYNAVFRSPLDLNQEDIIKDMYDGSAFLKELYLLSQE